MIEQPFQGLAEVKQEITLYYYLHPTYLHPSQQGRPGLVTLSSLEEGVEVAQKIAGQYKDSCGVKTILTAFQINKHLTATLCGHKMANTDPIILQAKSYFGALKSIKNDRHFKHYVEANSGERFMLYPAERVYDLKTGNLLHTEPS